MDEFFNFTNIYIAKTLGEILHNLELGHDHHFLLSDCEIKN